MRLGCWRFWNGQSRLVCYHQLMLDEADEKLIGKSGLDNVWNVI